MRASYAQALEARGWIVDTHPDGGYVATRGAQGAWGRTPGELVYRVVELEKGQEAVRTRPCA